MISKNWATTNGLWSKSDQNGNVHKNTDNNQNSVIMCYYYYYGSR